MSRGAARAPARAADRAAELAADAARMVGTNASLARRAAQQATAAARAGGDGRTAALALRTHGRAALELGRLDEATQVLRAAVREAERAGEPVTAAEARVTLAYALSERGRTADALRQLDRAAQVLRGRSAAPMYMQRGVVLWRCGRTDEALEAYRKALPVLRRGPDRLMEARLYNNRSLVYIDLGEMAAAEADLMRVVALARAEGRTAWPPTPRPTSASSCCAAAMCRRRWGSWTRPRRRTGPRAWCRASCC